MTTRSAFVTTTWSIAANLPLAARETPGQLRTITGCPHYLAVAVGATRWSRLCRRQLNVMPRLL
jgi:hypothetical protein